jgi:hypothetical protein
MLPLDPVRQAEYRERQRRNRALQVTPRGWKKTPEQIARSKAAIKASPLHRSKHQTGEKNAFFKRGWRLDKHGYRVIRVDGREVMEHREVMQKMIGRKLTAEETVHHKNGDRADNRETNLELWSSRNPKGQRVIDKVRFAREILAIYGDDFSTEDEFLS